MFQEIFHLLGSFEILLDDTEDGATLRTVLQEINLINSNPKGFSVNKDFFVNLSDSGFTFGYSLEGFESFQ